MSHDSWIYVIMYKLFIFRYTPSNIICIYLYINLIIHNYTILININAYNHIIYIIYNIYIQPQPDLKTLKLHLDACPTFDIFTSSIWAQVLCEVGPLFWGHRDVKKWWKNELPVSMDGGFQVSPFIPRMQNANLRRHWLGPAAESAIGRHQKVAMAQTPRLRSPAAVRGVEDVEPSTGLTSGSHSDGGLHSPGSKKEYRGSPALFWHFLAGV